MAIAQKNHLAWGEWIDRRRRFVGFASQARFADAVGCSRQSMTNWLSMSDAPKSMRRGLDVELARLLRVDRFMLLTGYRNVAPEAAPIVDAVTGHGENAETLKRKVHAVVELLDADRLRELHQRGRELLKQEMAAPASAA